MDTAWLLWGSLFSLIGFAIFRYGRKQQHAAATLIGVVLMVYPSFVSDVVILVIVGVLLIAGLLLANRFAGGL